MFCSGEASPTIYSCYVNFLELMVCKNNQFLKKWIMIELSLTIEIYIAGVKNRAGFATCFENTIPIIHIAFQSSDVHSYSNTLCGPERQAELRILSHCMLLIIYSYTGQKLFWIFCCSCINKSRGSDPIGHFHIHSRFRIVLGIF